MNADFTEFVQKNSCFVSYLGLQMRFGVSCLCSHDELAVSLRKPTTTKFELDIKE